jgi:hypothetical protein
VIFDNSGWVKVEGKFQHIFSGPETVIALAGNRDIYFRANVFERDESEVRVLHRLKIKGPTMPILLLGYDHSR